MCEPTTITATMKKSAEKISRMNLGICMPLFSPK
jgi:hypothetical protein